MSDQGFYKLMSVTHVGEDHHKIIMWSPHQVRAEYDRESLGSHLVMLFVVSNPGKCHSATMKIKEGMNAPIQMLRHSLQYAEVSLWKTLHNVTNP